MKIGPGTIVSYTNTIKTVKIPQKLYDLDPLAEISNDGGEEGFL